MGSIFTYFLKFFYYFLLIVYNDGYYESLKSWIKKKLGPKKNNNLLKKRKRSSSSDPFDLSYEHDVSFRENARGFFKSFYEISSSCIEKSNDTFDLSLGFLFALVFVYLTFGAIFASRIANWSLFNGYYFSLISLTKIGLGDLVIDDTKFILFSSIYALFGLAFFDLTILTLQEKLRLILIKNAKHLLTEICKFATQFGYNWSIEKSNLNLDNLGKNSMMSNLAIDIANKNSKAEQKDEALAYMNNVHLSAKRGGKKNKFSFDRTDLDVIKCDKQTQITTLLCSRFKLNDGRGFSSLSSSCTNLTVDQISTPIQIAPVKPNLMLDKLIEERLTREDDEPVKIKDKLSMDENTTSARPRRNRFNAEVTIETSDHSTVSSNRTSRFNS